MSLRHPKHRHVSSNNSKGPLNKLGFVFVVLKLDLFPDVFVFLLKILLMKDMFSGSPCFRTLLRIGLLIDSL